MSVSETPETGGTDVSDAYAPVLDDSDFNVVDLTCKSDDPPQEPEVLVDVWNGNGEFVRIPVVQTELWVNKDGPADINRTAKVKFPGEWGGIDIQSFVDGFNGTEGTSYDIARVWFYDETNENYQITHFGYIGGVGPASESGVFKFWVYDPADLLKGVPVTQSFGEPTIAQILAFATEGTDEAGDPVGLGNRTVFEQVAPIQTHLAGIQEVKLQKTDTSQLGKEVSMEDGEISVGPFSITDLIDDIFDYLLGTEVTNSIIGGQKSFKRNRHNMVDVMNWFADRVGGKWHFEPTPSGPILWYDNKSQERGNDQLVRRTFVEKELTTEEGPQLEEDGDLDIEVFDTFTTIDNQALRDMKPFNTLRLYGESSRPTRYTAGIEGFSDAASSSALGEAFPFVEVTYQPLLDRADGHRMMKEVESDEKWLDSAREKAVKQFRQEVEEETEGNMKIKGEPYIVPYDYVLNVPVCERIFTDVDAAQTRYEVNSVKHTRKAGERFTTELGVSLALRSEDINVEAEYKPA